MKAPFIDRIKALKSTIDPETHVKTAIANASQEWRALDAELLTQTNSSSSAANVKAKIDVPRLVSLSDIGDLVNEEVLSQCQFEKLPADNAKEYTHRLTQIFASIPKLHVHRNDNQNGIDFQTLHYNAFAEDLQLMPELEIPTVKAEKEFLSSKEKLFVFGVYNPRSKNIQQRVEILGSQSLSQLKQTIYCVQDCYNQQEAFVSSSSFFFVKSCFYGEQVEGETNCIADIRVWLSRLQLPSHRSIQSNANEVTISPSLPTICSLLQGRSAHSSLTVDLNALTVQAMEECAIDSLALLIGDSMLYCHQFHCEHVLVLLEVLLPLGLAGTPPFSSSSAPTIHLSVNHEAASAQLRSIYPKESFRAKFRKRRCDVCRVLSAELLVYHDRLATAGLKYCHIATLFCKPCFHVLHYGTDDKLLYDDFLVYPYFHDNV